MDYLGELDGVSEQLDEQLLLVELVQTLSLGRVLSLVLKQKILLVSYRTWLSVTWLGPSLRD